MRDASDIVVRSISDLEHFVRARPWGWMSTKGAISLQLPLIDARVQTKTEARFNFWRTVCGCQIGALLLIATLAVRVPAMLRTAEWTWGALAREAGIALLAAMLGKAVAIVGARLLLATDAALFLRRARQTAANIVRR